MKCWFALVLNLAVVGSLLCVAQGVQASAKAADSMVIAISGPDHPIPSFSPVPIDVTITNLSSQDLRLEDFPGLKPCYEIDVHDSARKRLPRRPVDEHLIFPRRIKVLKPGQEWTEELFLNGSYYDLSEPGEYTVQLMGPGGVASNTIKIEIVAGSLPPGSPTLNGVQAGPRAFDLGIGGPPVVKAGSPYKVRIGLRNISEEDIVIQKESEGKAEFDYSVEVIHYPKPDQLVRLPQTEYGKSLSDRKLSMPVTLWKSVTLHPQKVLTDEIVVSDLFDLQPGEYLISVSRRDELSSWNRIGSNSFLVTVVP
jgi:hypothetical protein